MFQTGPQFKWNVSASLLLLILTLHAQTGNPSTEILKGEISQEGSQHFDDLWMELVAHGNRVGRASVSPSGDFQFAGVAPGEYELRVVNRYGDVVTQEFVSVHGDMNELVLKLPSRIVARPASGRVSLQQLGQHVPSKARSELRRAQKSFQKGKIEDSISHLKKAIDLSPQYLEAHNNLGVCYMRTDEFQLAVNEFQRAVDLDSGAALAHANLALALIAVKQYDHAESAARRAIAIDPGVLQARYALGLIAVALNQCTSDAVENLRSVADRYSKGHLAAARLLYCRGETAQAAAELRRYLEVSDASDRAAVKSWLSQLETTPTR